MKFQPKSEKDIAEMNLLPNGEYSFDIMESEEKLSKKGSPMLVLTLRLYDQELKPRGRVNDYLLESMPLKLRRAAYGCGLGESYESGHIDPNDFKEKTGVVKIGIQQDKTGQFPDKNVVLDYIAVKAGTPKLTSKTFQSFGATEYSDSDIPF